MKKSFKLCGVVALTIAAVLTFVGCGGGTSAKSKTFTNAGIGITATDEFQMKTMAGVTIYLESTNANISGKAEKIADLQLPANPTLRDYTNSVVTNKALQNVTISELTANKGKFDQFSYETTTGATKYTYLTVTAKNGDSFYVFNFGTESANYAKYKSNFLAWAKTITFAT